MSAFIEFNIKQQLQIYNFNMLSLSDEIIKFEKITYQNQLDGLISVEENFSNGSVTIRDLVKQNHTIIQQFKKMKNVFINYTKLHKKIYDRVTEYELHFGANILKLGNMTNFFEKTIEETLDRMKLIFQSTVQQNKASFETITNMINPLQTTLKQKVDMSYFIQQLKILNGSSSSQHDSMQHFKTENIKNQTQTPSQLNPFKLKKRISSEQLNNIRQAVISQLNEQEKYNEHKFELLNQRLDEAKKSNEKQFENVYGNLCEKQDQSSRELKELIKSQIRIVETEIYEKTKESVWHEHQERIISKIKQAQILPIHESIRMLKQGLEKYKQKAQNGLASLKITSEQSLLRMTSKLEIQIKTEAVKVEKRIQTQSNNLEQLKKQLKQKVNIINKLIDQNKAESKQNYLLISNQLNALKQNIEKVVVTLEASVLRNVNKRFQQDFNRLYAQFSKLKQLQVQTSKKIVKIFQIIQDIKDVTATKANFADMCQLYERKANKDEVGQIKNLITDIPREQILTAREGRDHMHTNRQRNSTELKQRMSFEHSRRLSSHKSIAENSFIMGLSQTERTNSKNKKYFSKRLKYRPMTADLTIFH